MQLTSMRFPLLFMLSFLCVRSVLGNELPPLTEEENGVTTVLRIYLRENNNPRAVELGKRVFRYAAKQRERQAQALAAYEQVARHLGVGKLDSETATQLANSGNAVAQFQLGIGYTLPTNAEDFTPGLPRDEERAAYWTKKAALNGIPRAQWILAMRNDATFQETIYWLIRVAAYGSEPSYRAASAMVNLSDNLDRASADQLEIVKNHKRSLSNVERLAADSLTLLANVLRGKSIWGDRKLNSDEERIAKLLLHYP